MSGVVVVAVQDGCTSISEKDERAHIDTELMHTHTDTHIHTDTHTDTHIHKQGISKAQANQDVR